MTWHLTALKGRSIKNNTLRVVVDIALNMYFVKVEDDNPKCIVLIKIQIIVCLIFLNTTVTLLLLKLEKVIKEINTNKGS